MTCSSASTTQFDKYMAHARHRTCDRQRQMYQRQQTGLAQANASAALLKQEFGVEEVFLFGSLLSPEFVHPDSDIDLAVWGLSRDRYCEAVGTLLCTVKGFNVDLVILETAPSSLFDCVTTQGIRL